MLLDDLQGPYLEHALLIAAIGHAIGTVDAASGIDLRCETSGSTLVVCCVLKATEFLGDLRGQTTFEGLVVDVEVDELVQADIDFARGSEADALLPVVVGVLHVADEGIEALAPRGVLRRGGAGIPLSDHVGCVTRLLQFLRHTRHVPRNAARTTYRIIRVVVRDASVHPVHVHRQTTGHQRRSGGRANSEGIMMLEQNTIRGQLVQVRGVNLRLKLLSVRSRAVVVDAEVGPAVVVRKQEQDIWL
mmetsp:Transcript_55411/g.121191  ORF Transcript_55411/g.121191 Transcript_55411/m.121191 type:complete len:246 (+) Transcript_55411:1518-2255(+)